jgi:ABC-type sugar transport system permease subunit
MALLGPRKWNASQERIAYLMILPFFFFFFFLKALPILINFTLSFTRYNLVRIKFIGLQNYIDLFTIDKTFHKSLLNTLIYTLFTLGFAMVFSLIVAVLLDQKIFFRRIYRTIFFVPYITSMVAMSMVWLWLYDPHNGAFNNILMQLGFPRISWLFDTRYALMSLIIMGIWKWIGYYMILYLAGLQGIPEYLYEAATIDGATPVQKFRHITIPMVRPVTFFIFITGFINNFRVFEQIMVMTGGGPRQSTTTIIHQIYVRAFRDILMGYAASEAIVALLIVLVITLLRFRYGRQGVDISA